MKISKDIFSEVIGQYDIVDFEQDYNSIFYTYNTYKLERNGISIDSFILKCVDYIITNVDSINIHKEQNDKVIIKLSIDNKNIVICDVDNVNLDLDLNSIKNLKFYSFKEGVLKACELILKRKQTYSDTDDDTPIGANPFMSGKDE